MNNTKIVDVTLENISDHPEAICFINPKHKLFPLKIDWLKDQFINGLKIKLLYLEGVKKAIGFIEYVPGEFCWRAVNAKGYMFIHCMWVNGLKYRRLGLGSKLIKEVEKDAKDMLGVAVVTSKKSFMATQEIFIKNGYKLVSETDSDQLLVKKFIDGSLPLIKPIKRKLANNQGLTIHYSKQCPWVARFIEEVKPILNAKKINPKVIEYITADEAQNAPSIYSVFNLEHNGKLLADRYISTTRFKNIISKEIKL